MPNQKTVLLVEDDAVLKEMYLARFASEGFKTIEVGSGEEAKEKIEADKIDLVLLDIMLPGQLSGLDVLSWLRGREETKDLPVLLLSALATDEDKMRGHEMGANGYLSKSELTPEQVVEKIHQFV